MTLAQALAFPNARIIFLIQATAGIWCRAWVQDATYTNTYKVAMRWEVQSIRWGPGDYFMTALPSVILVNVTPGSYFTDGTNLWINPPLTQNPFTSTVQAVVSFWWSNHPKIHDNRFYDPRLLTSPTLNRRINPFFGFERTIGAGALRFANGDGFFNLLQDAQWDAGQVTIKLGCDTFNAEMAYADYQTSATWIPEQWTRTVEHFEIRVTEPKNRLKTNLPFTFFDRASFPNIDQGWVGKAIPIVYGRNYGVQAIPVDPGSKRFKVAGHAIRDLSAVRIEKTTQERRNITPGVNEWFLYSGTTYRYYLSGAVAQAVTFGGASLSEVDTAADCTATAGTWCNADSYVLVNPSSGQTITSGTYTIEAEAGVTAFHGSNFATKDLANGEFTLGPDWVPGTPISVDVVGKVDGSGILLGNTVDIVQDILTTAGEVNLNVTTFSAARAKLRMGTDESGSEVFSRAAGLVISEPTDVPSLISELLRACLGFIFSDQSGQYSIGIFEPRPSENLPEFDDADWISFEEETDAAETFSKISTAYARHTIDEYDQISARESTAQQYLRKQVNPAVSEREISLATAEDADFWSDKTLGLEGRPVKRFRGVIPWRGLTLQPGDHVRARITNGTISKVLEVLEVTIDVSDKTATLVLGDLRGLGDSSGFWVDDSGALPTRFASYAGYGTGSLAWNKNWHAEIKAWARENVGYWTDENGFADATDPDSFMGSTWN